MIKDSPIMIVLGNGVLVWVNADSKYHRENGPAVVYPDGTRQWYKNGALHRLDGPAVIESDGCQEWRNEGLRHCEDGPTLINPDGRVRYFLNGREV